VTTVAWDGTSLAADRQTNAGGLRGRTRKLFRLKDGGVAGISGDLAYGRAVIRWLNGKGPRPTETPEKADASILLVRPGGHPLLIAGSDLTPYPAGGKFWAIGSGRDFAIAVMDLGLSAEEAVRRAAKFDVYTGGGVAVMQPRK